MIAIPALYEFYRKFPLISTDSRQVIPGSIFFALKGNRFDGNEFALTALDAGAVVAVIDDPGLRQTSNCLFVPNVLTALQRLAAWHRDSLDIPVIAVTGSNGKTTTKELISAVLRKKFQVRANAGNLNNHIGVPLTILSIPPETEIAVIEMGANRRGDISMLSHMAKPTHGLITNIGRAHLEGLESLDGVMEVKSELFYYLVKSKGKIFLNRNEKSLDKLATLFRDCLGYQSEPLLDYVDAQVQCISVNPGVVFSFRFQDQIFQLQSSLFGEYNFQNILTAIAIGVYFGVPAVEIGSAIESFRSLSNRSQRICIGSNIFFLDAYNANPSSVERALDFFESVQHSNKTVILGDMLELGPDTEDAHTSVLNRIISTPEISMVILVGPLFERAVRNKKIAGELLHFSDVGSLKNWFDDQHFENHCFLVKGSRSIALEKLLS